MTTNPTSYVLTQNDALDILGLFGGQYPWNDVNGFFLGLEALGLLEPSTSAPSAPEVAAVTQVEAPVEAVVAPSGQDAGTTASTTTQTTDTTTTPVAPAVNADGSPAA